MTETIRYAWGESSLGDFAVAASDRGLVMVAFAGSDELVNELLRSRHPNAEIIEDPGAMAETLRKVAQQIEHPERECELPTDVTGSDFELRVWEALQAIPAGETATYGDIAQRIGSPKEAREVAEACAANPLAVVVPCHRVVKKDGSISGYRWGFKRKRALIEREHRALFHLA